MEHRRCCYTGAPLLLSIAICFAVAAHCDARELKHSRKNSLVETLYKLRFANAVVSSSSLAPQEDDPEGGMSTTGTINPPFCINPPMTPLPPIAIAPAPPISSSEPPPPSATNPPPLIIPNPPEGIPSPPSISLAPPQVVTSPPFVIPNPPSATFPSPPRSVPRRSPFMPPVVFPPPLAPPPPPGAMQPLWCVAKPTVPDPIIQEAMDYACGSGADCSPIQPSGSCYHPDTVIAHASYAFNNYWQQTKASGGTCDFGGTAILVTRDPSYEECQFNMM